MAAMVERVFTKWSHFRLEDPDFEGGDDDAFESELDGSDTDSDPEN